MALKARFIPLGIAFGGCRKRVGFIRFEKGEIFWKNTKGTAEGTSKDLDNSVPEYTRSEDTEDSEIDKWSHCQKLRESNIDVLFSEITCKC